MSERMDWVAFKNGNAYALCSADGGARVVRDFFAENAGAEIKLLPVAEAVRLHMEWLRRAFGLQASPSIDSPG